MYVISLIGNDINSKEQILCKFFDFTNFLFDFVNFFSLNFIFLTMYVMWVLIGNEINSKAQISVNFGAKLKKKFN